MEDIASMQNAWEEEKKHLQQQAYEEGFQVGYEEGQKQSDFRNDCIDSTANETTRIVT